MNNLFVDLHAIQTVPPSNLNRDDSGSPKTALYGGVRRARVSSQSWKKAMRDWFAYRNDDLLHGLRTQDFVRLVKEELEKRPKYKEVDDGEREKVALAIRNVLGFKKGKHEGKIQYLVLVSRRQINNVIDVIDKRDAVEFEHTDDDDKLTLSPEFSKEERREIKNVFNRGQSVDLAAFGRMVADDTDLNVDAAVQVAHSIGVDAVQSEFDFFTAVDDYAKNTNDDDHANAGAGMIGNVEYDSATFYRYENISLAQLNKNLDNDEQFEKVAVENLVRAFIESIPTGKQNTFAAQTLPSVVIVEVRDSRPLSYVQAFEKPVKAGEYSIAETAARTLKDYVKKIDDSYGAPLHRYVVDLTDVFDENKLPEREIASTVANELFPDSEPTDESTGEVSESVENRSDHVDDANKPDNDHDEIMDSVQSADQQPEDTSQDQDQVSPFNTPQE